MAKILKEGTISKCFRATLIEFVAPQNGQDFKELSSWPDFYQIVSGATM